MNITFLLPPVSMSGGIRVVAIYAQWLRSRGHNVLLISPAARSVPFWRRLISLLKGNGWPEPGQHSSSHLDGSGLPHLQLETYRAPCDGDVPDGDVLISTWWETAEWSMNLAASKGARVYFVQGHEIFPFLPVDRVEATYRLPMHKIAVATWLKKLMNDRYGDPTCDVVPNSVDKHLFFAPFRSKQSVPTMGFLVSEAPLKGFNTAIAVVQKLRLLVPTLRVFCFGSRAGQDTKQMLAANGCEFVASPPQALIRELYASCDVWLSTSRSEGFNLTAIEAMACRTPVVSTRTGWPVEVVKDGWNGFLADIDDVDNLSSRTLAVLSLDNRAWTEMSQNALETVGGTSWEVSSMQFEAALEHAIKRSNCREIFGVVATTPGRGCVPGNDATVRV